MTTHKTYSENRVLEKSRRFHYINFDGLKLFITFTGHPIFKVPEPETLKMSPL